VALAQVQLPGARYDSDAKIQEFYQRLFERLAHTPGIQSAAGISDFFLGRLPNAASFSIEGRPDRISMPLTADAVTPEFFSAMKIPLVGGRWFDARDRIGSLPVTMVNRAMADHYWPNGDPLGKRITFDDPTQVNARWYTIVGVVADTRRAGADRPVFTESYYPLAQAPSRAMQIVLRGSGTRAALQAAIHAVDPGQPISSFATLDAALGEQLASRRFTTFLLSLFAATALIITAVGLYGLVSYLVAQRRREFDIRVALGAQARSVLWMVLSQARRLAAYGLIGGTVGMLALGRLLDSLLFGVTRFDPVSYIAAAAGLFLITLAAALSPALRAVRTSPLVSLRAE